MAKLSEQLTKFQAYEVSPGTVFYSLKAIAACFDVAKNDIRESPQKATPTDTSTQLAADNPSSKK